MRRAEYKVHEGKLLVAEAMIEGEKISNVKITGDFFMHPEESIKDLEESLRGAEINSVEEVIDQFFQENEITLFGVSASDFSHVIRLCIEKNDD